MWVRGIERIVLFIAAIACIVLSGSVLGHDLTEEELLKYETPQKMKDLFPYYLSGYDEDGAPIWVWEFGKWDVRSIVEKGGKDYDDMDKSADHMFLDFRESGRNATDKQGFVTIMDLNGYPLSQAGHLRTITFVISKFRKFEELIKDGDMKVGWIINANYLFERVWQIGKPLLGVLANSIQVYGTNPSTWKPLILKTIRRDQIPEWYGGLKNFTPVQVCG
jgi:hypothetical protein